MTLDEILVLVKAGYSKDEISAFASGTTTEAPAPSTADPIPEPEAPKNIVTPDAPTQAPETKQITEQAAALLNILNGVPIPPKVSIDDKLTALLNGLIVGEKKGE